MPNSMSAVADQAKSTNRARKRPGGRPAQEHRGSLEARTAGLLLETASEAAFLFDREGTIRWVNPAAGALIGQSVAELVGVALSDLFPTLGAALSEPPGAETRNPALEPIAEGIDYWTVPWVAPGGHRTSLLARIVTFELDGDHYSMLLAREETGDGAVESPFAATGIPFKLIAETASEAIISVDSDLRILFFNGSAERVFGYGAEELLGQAMEMLIPERFRAGHAGHVASFAESGASMRTMGERSLIVGRHKTGREFPAEASISRFELNGRTMFNVVLRDISQRMQREQELRERQRLFRAAFNQTFQLAAILDRSGAITEINQTALDFAGLTRDEVIGALFWAVRWSSRARPEALAQLEQSFGRALRGETVRREMTVVDRDDQVRTIDFSFKPVRDEDGKSILVMAEGRDISKRKSYETALVASKVEAERANRAKSDFLAIMSHELRTPLNAIIGFSEMLEAEPYGALGHESYRSYADDIKKSGRHLLEIIDDILDLARLEAGRVELQESELVLTELVEDCLRIVEDPVRSGGLIVKRRIEPGARRLLADEAKLRKAVLTLLSNAIKFTPPGGRIEIGARRELDGAVAISVTDTGQGIARQDLERVLEPFGQADDLLRRRHGGTGLGLPLAKSLAEKHGGSLTIESDPGSGTEVAIRLPASRALPDDPEDRI